MTLAETLYALAYLVAAILFIVGLKRLSSPATARSGNQIAGGGMLLAVVVTLVRVQLIDWPLILVGIAVGSAAGFWMARTVQMTAMPQMVALFNGMGGGAAALISLSEFINRADRPALGVSTWDELLSSLLSLAIGAVSFAGSMVAFGKLQGLISGRPITYPGYRFANAVLAGLIVLLGAVLMLAAPTNVPLLVLILVVGLVLGVALVLPIGGADMPVVISLLNSFTGTAAAMTGFVLGNNVLIISGALVGASGMLLTLLMAKAMNRSVGNVLFSGFGTGGGEAAAGPGGAGGGVPQRETSIEDAATMMAYARNVIVVPGYGLAVAQAQHAVRELAEVLQKRGVEVKYAIHPVAGRMPGHMNVLLAEANVPYDDLFEMEQINDQFSQTDVALVVGANDVTNPAARSNPQSPIYGMPILNVDQARHILVIKRGRGTGFAGIENELFINPNTQMIFADAKAGLSQLVEAVKAA